MRGTLPSRNRINIQNNNEETTEDLQKQKELIRNAPLRTDPNMQTNPSMESDYIEQKKPWREGINLSADELKTMTEKVSMNMPLELLLRLDYILQHDKKNRILGKKLNKTTMYVEAVEKYTDTKLKKMGLDVKD